MTNRPISLLVLAFAFVSPFASSQQSFGQFSTRAALPKTLLDEGGLSELSIQREFADAPAKAVLNELWPTSKRLSEIQLSDGQKNMALAGTDGALLLYALQDGSDSFQLLENAEDVKQFAFVDSSRAVGIDSDDRLTSWTLDQDATHRSTVEWEGGGKPMAISSNGRFVAGTKGDSPIVFDIDEGASSGEALSFVPDIKQMTFSPSRRLVVAAYSENANRIVVWELPGKGVLRDFEIDGAIGRIISVSTDETSIAIETADKRLCIYSISESFIGKSSELKIPEGSRPFVSEDHNQFGTVDSDGVASYRATVATRREIGELYFTVPVYFGTNRKIDETLATVNLFQFFRDSFGLIVSAVVGVVLILLLIFTASWHWKFAWIVFSIFTLLAMAITQFVTEGRRTEIPIGMEFVAVHESGDLNLGKCEVTVPDDHVVGTLESPFEFWVVRAKSDPNSHVLLNSVTKHRDATEFANAVNVHLTASDKKQGFLFIHGFNVSFPDAVRRTAQLQVDLHFDGPAFCYSWPSHGNFLRYNADESNAGLSREKLVEFIKIVLEQTDVESLNIIAHSMGNRVLGEAFRTLTLSDDSSGKITNLILAAPDVDQRAFIEQIAPSFCKKCSQITLYASSNDNALELSQQIHAYQRAGDTTPEPTIVEGIYTIDASTTDTSLLGHSYYGDRIGLLNDIYEIFDGDHLPDKRFGLQRINAGQKTHWKFRGGIK